MSSKVVGIRLQPEYEEFYREQADKHKMTLSEYLRYVLVEAHAGLSMQSAEQRIKDLLQEAQQTQVIPKQALTDIIFTRLLMVDLFVKNKTPEDLFAMQKKAELLLKGYYDEK